MTTPVKFATPITTQELHRSSDSSGKKDKNDSDAIIGFGIIFTAVTMIAIAVPYFALREDQCAKGIINPGHFAANIYDRSIFQRGVCEIKKWPLFFKDRSPAQEFENAHLTISQMQEKEKDGVLTADEDKAYSQALCNMIVQAKSQHHDYLIETIAGIKNEDHKNTKARFFANQLSITKIRDFSSRRMSYQKSDCTTLKAVVKAFFPDKPNHFGFEMNMTNDDDRAKCKQMEEERIAKWRHLDKLNAHYTCVSEDVMRPRCSLHL